MEGPGIVSSNNQTPVNGTGNFPQFIILGVAPMEIMLGRGAWDLLLSSCQSRVSGNARNFGMESRRFDNRYRVTVVHARQSNIVEVRGSRISDFGFSRALCQLNSDWLTSAAPGLRL
jgi:hypothetical protein